MNVAPAFAKLGDVAAFVRGVTFKPDDIISLAHDDAVACMRTRNVQVDLDVSDVWALSKTFVKNEAQFLKAGDILVSTANSLNLVGKCCWVPKLPWPATLGGFISALRPSNGKVEPRYLYRWFSSEPIQAKVRACARQTTNIANLSFEQCLAIKIPLPPLNEQRRIATILDQADDLRRKRREALSKLDELPQAVFVKMFGSRELQKFSNISRLDKYLSFITSGGRDWSKYYCSVGHRFIRSLDVQMNRIGTEDIVFVNPPDNAEARRTRTRTGDILLTITGSRIGRVAPLPDELAGSYVSQHVAILRVNKDEILPQYLSFFLSLGSGGQRQIAKAQYGQTKPGLNFEQIRDFLIPVPSMQQQAAFLRALASVEMLRGIQLRHAAKLDSLFQSMQYRAFQAVL